MQNDMSSIRFDEGVLCSLAIFLLPTTSNVEEENFRPPELILSWKQLHLNKNKLKLLFGVDTS